MFKYTAVAALCGWATYVQMVYRVPGSFVFVLLPWIGLALSCLSFVFLANHFLARLPRDHPFLETLRRFEWWAIILMRVYVYFSLFIYANAKLDRSFPVAHHSMALSITKSHISLGSQPLSWVTLRSWNNPKKAERLLLTDSEEPEIWGGEALIVKLRSGYFGIPWVATIARDAEQYAREILKLAPTASTAWKQLVNFYLDQEKWHEALEATESYLKEYPRDHNFAASVGGIIAVAGHYGEATPLLERAVEIHPTYEGYQLLGWALSWAGNRKRAAEVLETSIALAPDDWEAYYHLGYVYDELGRQTEALKMFGEVLKRQPHFPEVAAQIANLSKQINSSTLAERRTDH